MGSVTTIFGIDVVELVSDVAIGTAFIWLPLMVIWVAWEQGGLIK